MDLDFIDENYATIAKVGSSEFNLPPVTVSAKNGFERRFTYKQTIELLVPQHHEALLDSLI